MLPLFERLTVEGDELIHFCLEGGGGPDAPGYLGGIDGIVPGDLCQQELGIERSRVQEDFRRRGEARVPDWPEPSVMTKTDGRTVVSQPASVSSWAG
jgi:hypothetical protein